MVSPVAPRSRVKLFGHPFLEAFTVISLPAFIALWAVILPAMLVAALLYAPTGWAPLLALAGVIVWTWTEYALHRFVFHLEARSGVVRRIIFVVHGNHHSFPNDALRNMMPPIVSLPVGALIGLGCVSLMGPAGLWCWFGFMLGYVTYDLVHYATHQWPMKAPLWRRIKVHHMRHHHHQAEGNYAVTGMIWDRILSTRIPAARERV